jgi:hypothetical protein
MTIEGDMYRLRITLYMLRMNLYQFPEYIREKEHNRAGLFDSLMIILKIIPTEFHYDQPRFEYTSHFKHMWSCDGNIVSGKRNAVR